MSDFAVIVAARQTSERLPGKAMIGYAPDGMSNLEQIVRRWRASRREPAVVVATTDERADDDIAIACWKMRAACYRGPRDDVVARMDGALRAHAPDARWVARALADNPLVDVSLADYRLDILTETGADGLHYSGQEARITYAGTTDVWSRAAWDRIVAGSSGSQREHPGVHFWEALHAYDALAAPLPPREYLVPLRTELDTPDDLAMFRAVWAGWWATGPHGWDEPCVPTLWALDWLRAHPEAARLNAGVPVKTQTRAGWAKGKPWLCKHCASRMAGIVAGDLEVACDRCDKKQKFYARPPERRR